MRSPDDKRCVTCGKGREEVKKLIIGIHGGICLDCVDLCDELLRAGNSTAEPAPPSPKQAGTPRMESCVLCGKSRAQVQRLLSGKHGGVCAECIDLCNDIIRTEVKETPTPEDPVPESTDRLEGTPMSETILTTEIPGLPLHARGKVRDIYDLGDALLIVTTDRISAFDVVMPNGIPDKGRVLTYLSRFWFLHLRPFIANHYITYDTAFIAARLGEKGAKVTPDLHRMLEGRAMLVLKAAVFPIECVVRGYLAGSLWKEYKEAGGETQAVTLHGITLPAGLRESERLPEPLFTPATKATTGHDENISFAEMRNIVGTDDAGALRQASLNIYKLAAERALRNGLILADTKFEFGIHNGNLTLVDEVLTPDSSRYWDAAVYTPGKSQPSFDKQYLRDWLTESGWNKEPPAPKLPDEVVRRTADKYREAYRRVTGEALPK